MSLTTVGTGGVDCARVSRRRGRGRVLFGIMCIPVLIKGPIVFFLLYVGWKGMAPALAAVVEGK